MNRLSSFGFTFLFVSFFGSAMAEDFLITRFGAKSDGTTINTKAIQKAIDSCSSGGGGRVVVPTGVFMTGTLNLKSHVNLVLEAGSVLRGSPDLNDYQWVDQPGFGKTYFGILYTRKAVGVTISGTGEIDGNEAAFFDWTRAKSIEWGGTIHTRQKEGFRKVESGIGDGPVVPRDRPRQLVIFSECNRLTIRDVSINRAPFWTLHLADCDDATIAGIRIHTSPLTPNSDGLDLTSCSNIRVSDCDIRTGDDAIAITGYAHHFELPGFSGIRRISENITISNCTLQSSSSGIRIGFLDQNTIRNVLISNVTITNSNRGIGIFLRDEGSIENVVVTNTVIDTRLFTGDWWGNGEPIHVSAVRGKESVRLGQIRNITFRDVTCTGESGLLLFGSEESPLDRIRFENVSFRWKDSQLASSAGGNIDLRGCMGEMQLFESDLPGLLIKHASRVYLSGFSLEWPGTLQPWMTHGVEATKVQGLIMEQSVTPASSKEYLPVKTSDVSGMVIR
ncbi:MAG: right-handed parallel beta-helix repeat-containing protein [Bacteroidetes bacterium]|nr:right-handed parallel beta-helix repeat-containing protein [Bacteroidota bacterium]